MLLIEEGETMDAQNMGAMIRALRTERNMTQAELAGRLHLSDKAISKWERGMGCPDISLLPALAQTLGADVSSLLSGRLDTNELDGGNMKRIRFYTCPSCGNVITATGEADISCCGRKLEPMQAKACDEAHTLRLEPVDDELYVSFDHTMEKGHYIRFVACLGCDRMTLVRLYPEQGGELRLPRMGHGTLYIGCNRDGLMQQRF